MKPIFIAFALFSTFAYSASAQTLSETQMRNARATGYAIVAARNPGKSFSIYVIPWNSAYSTLEGNANAQINSGWHAQAAVKGSFFDQAFNGNDFSQYSSVVTSEAEFQTYKNTGTQWWIICSTLPSFSNSITTNTDGSVSFASTVTSNTNLGFLLAPPSGDAIIRRSTPGNLILSSNGGTSEVRFNFNYGGGSGGVAIYDGSTVNNATLKVNSSGHLSIASSGGNVGIGTTPSTTIDSKLTVAGTVRAREVRVNINAGADFVFDKNFNLKPLPELEHFIKQNSHLPDIEPAAQMEVNGVELGKMDIKLLQKIEELTLYLIEQNKKIETLEKKLALLNEEKKR